MDSLKKYAQEVKTKVLNLNRTPLEKTLHEATSNENWGSNPRIFREISDESYKNESRQTILDFIFHRMSNQNKNWRKILKTLELIEYLLKNGLGSLSEDFRRNIFHIRTHCDFSLVEGGVDRGIPIRQKANLIVNLLSDDSELQYQRQNARILAQKSMNLQGFGSSENRVIEDNQKYQNQKQRNGDELNDNEEYDDYVEKNNNKNWDKKFTEQYELEDSDGESKRENQEVTKETQKQQQQQKQKQQQQQQQVQPKLNFDEFSKNQNTIHKKDEKKNKIDPFNQQWDWGFPTSQPIAQTNSNSNNNTTNTSKGFWNIEGFNESSQVTVATDANKSQQQQKTQIKEEKGNIWELMEPQQQQENQIQQKQIQSFNNNNNKKQEPKNEINLLDLDLDLKPNDQLNTQPSQQQQLQHQQQQQQQLQQNTQQQQIQQKNLIQPEQQRDYSALNSISNYQQMIQQQQQYQYGQYYYYQNPNMLQQQQQMAPTYDSNSSNLLMNGNRQLPANNTPFSSQVSSFPTQNQYITQPPFNTNNNFNYY